MLKALAEALGRFQEKLCSPLFEIGPQIRKERKSSIPRLWISGISGATPQSRVGAFRVKLFAKFVTGNKPRHPTPYYLQQTLYSLI
jgi:hypothetical protein